MAEVKWIKLTTDMFDNRKIKHLRRLPDGNSIVLIWVMLLTMAGRCNANGMIFLTENIPYTPKMLADELDFEENTVKLALKALEDFNMIVTDGDLLVIAGWEEYQNIEGMDKIREQNRIRQKKWYDKHKMLNSPNVEPNVRLTQPNATEEEIEKDKEKDKEIDSDKVIIAQPAPKSTPKKAKKDKPEKNRRGEFQHVLLTDDEEDKLFDEYGMEFALKAITFLDEYIEENKDTKSDYKKKNHYLCIKRWVIDAVKEKEEKAIKKGEAPKQRYGNFDVNEAFQLALARSYDDDDDDEEPITAAKDDYLRERMEALKERLS